VKGTCRGRRGESLAWATKKEKQILTMVDEPSFVAFFEAQNGKIMIHHCDTWWFTPR